MINLSIVIVSVYFETIFDEKEVFSVLSSLYAYLNSQEIPYQVHMKPDDFSWMEPGESQENWIRAVLLQAEEVEQNTDAFAASNVDLISSAKQKQTEGILNSKTVLAILPANRMLDFNRLASHQHTTMSLLKGDEADQHMKKASAGIRVPLPGLFDLTAILDENISDMDSVWFEAGDGVHYIEMSSRDFLSIHTSIDRLSFSFPLSSLYLPEGTQMKADPHFADMRIQGRIEDLSDLPPMPGIALDILSLKSNRHACAKDLAEIVRKDPGLSAQVMGWANSAFYGYRGEIDSIETAISRVLGFDRVINLSLGIVLGNTLQVPSEGPLGLNNYWKQALLTANLAEKLSLKMNVQTRPVRGIVYLAGLLHNIGHLLLGHAFPPQFFVLNRFIEVNPHIQVSDIEKYVLGVTHEQIGAWLLKSWNLPAEICEATRWHHQEEYASPHAAYSNLIFLANHMLGSQFIGDSRPGTFPEAVLELLGLSKQDAESVWMTMDEFIPEVDSMARQLAA